jgi:hypothetical protein
MGLGDGLGRWTWDRNAFPPEDSRSRLPPVFGLLYHNGTSLYQNDAAACDILYGLNGRRTNRARIGDEPQIFVCSLQYIGADQIFDPTNCKTPGFWPKHKAVSRECGQTRKPTSVNCPEPIFVARKRGNRPVILLWEISVQYAVAVTDKVLLLFRRYSG